MLLYVGWLITPSVKYTQPVLPMGPVRLTYWLTFKDVEEGRSPFSNSARLEIRLQETLSAITIYSNMAVFGFSLCYHSASLLYSTTVEGHLTFTSAHMLVLALC